MSDGSWDSMKWLLQDKDAIDGKDWLDFDDTEITEIVKNLNQKYPNPKNPWLDFCDWLPKSYKCDCGAKVAKTTCAHWCSSRKV